MAKFYWGLQCEVHGTLNGTAFPALTTALPNTPPVALCPIDATHKIDPGSLRFLYTDNPAFLRVGLAWQHAVRLRTVSDTYVSDPNGEGDFFYSTRIVPVGTVVRVGLAVKRDAGSTVSSAEVRIVQVNPDGSDGSAMPGTEMTIPFTNDDLQVASSGAFVLATGFNLYRFQVKKTGGLITEGATLYQAAVTALMTS